VTQYNNTRRYIHTKYGVRRASRMRRDDNKLHIRAQRTALFSVQVITKRKNFQSSTSSLDSASSGRKEHSPPPPGTVVVWSGGVGAREVEAAFALLRLLIYTSVFVFFFSYKDPCCWRRKGIRRCMLGGGLGRLMTVMIMMVCERKGRKWAMMGMIRTK
jgi:hypothetical protein